jgi:murein L,D-transpeptidase YcbB/YkuD
VSLLAAPVAGGDEPFPDVRDFLLGNGCPVAACDSERGASAWQFVQRFYAGRGYAPAWFRDGEMTEPGHVVGRVLADAARDGLDPVRYDPRWLSVATPVVSPAETAVSVAAPDPRAVLDVGLTYGFVRYASDLGQGLFDVRGRGPFWRTADRTFALAPVLEEALAGRAFEAIAAVRPPLPQYAALAAALARYRALAARGGWPAVDAKPGAPAALVRGLAARLALSGDATLQHFQERHGLSPTGRLDAATLAALNVPVEERVRQIELNLERWRWQRRPTASREVLVNIPTFELHAYEGTREALHMRVITGQGDSPTPVFSQDMTGVVFSPSWTVPPNMAATETLPAVLRDRSYLRRKGLEVVLDDRVVDPARVNWRRVGESVQFRQRPGARNALGGVKFLLPNPFHVYLHDTPDDGLFARTRRTLSHGCVRLEQPEALARWVLMDAPQWTDARIHAAMTRGREEHVALAEPIPVTIAYFTVWVADDGTVSFRPDVYRHDAAQVELLPAAPAGGAAVLAFRKAGA